jgi:hypothetical protein
MTKASARKLDVQQRQQLFDTLNRWVIKNGAWITSPPGSKRLRIEVPHGSNLPTRLTELGYKPRHVGMDTRLAAVGTHGAFLLVDVIEVTLG